MRRDTGGAALAPPPARRLGRGRPARSSSAPRSERHPGAGCAGDRSRGVLVFGLVVYLTVSKPSADGPRTPPGDPLAVPQPGGAGPGPAPFQPPVPQPVNNWDRLVGTWRQQPGGPDGYAAELTFLPDRTAHMLFQYADGREVRHNARAEIGAQGLNLVSLQLHIANGSYGYSFKFRDADTIQIEPGDPPAVPVYARVRR